MGSIASASQATERLGSEFDTPQRLPLRNPSVGAEIMGAAVVRGKQQNQTKAGNPYLTITLGTHEGEITAKIWSEQVPLWAAIDVGRGVNVRAVVKPGYQGGAPELAISRVELLEEGHPVEREMHPISPVPFTRLTERYEHLVACLTPRGTALLGAVTDAVGEAYRVAPAAVTHHHAYLHGLWEHSIEVAELALALAQHSPAATMIDWDALLVGALLHDIGKVHEYRWTGGPIRLDTHVTAITYHTVSGQLMIERVWCTARATLEAAGVRERDIAHLQHVIASHHGFKEYGSVVEPCSLEALLIHKADEVSATVRGRIDELLSVPGDEEGWVQPAGWRKTPVLSLLPPRDLACARGDAAAIRAAEDDADALAAFGDGEPVPPRGATREQPAVIEELLSALRAFSLTREARPAGASRPVSTDQGTETERGATGGGDRPVSGGEDHGAPEDVFAYLSYLIAQDLTRWDSRRRLRAEHAQALAERLRAALSVERRAQLDRYLTVTKAA